MKLKLRETTISELRGKVIETVLVAADKSVLMFVTNDKRYFQLYHEQDCNETVRIEDICGDLADLLLRPITQADEESNQKRNDPEFESMTWTFYRLSTEKGQVVIRWLGESNGYYSESVDFAEIVAQ